MTTKSLFPKLAIALALGLVSARAADLTWQGSVSNWFGATAWTNGNESNTGFSAGDSVWLTDAGLGNPVFNTITSSLSLGTMTVSNTSGNYTVPVGGSGSITGNTLTRVGSGTLTFGQNGAVGFTNTSLQGGTLVIRQNTFNGGAINVSGDVKVGAASTQTTNLNGTSLSGAGSLTLAPLEGGRIVLSGLSLAGFSGTIQASAAGQVNVTGGDSDLSGAKVVLSGNTLFQGSVIGSVQIGQINAGSSNVLGKSVDSVNATVYEIGALNTASSVAGVIRNGGIKTDGSASTGIVALTKVGTGTLSLTGANTYTGATTVNAGTLLLGDGTSGSITSAATVNAGALYGNLATGHVTTAAITVGNSSGIADAVFGAGESTLGRFSSSSSLTLNSDANFVFDLDSSTRAADIVTFSGAVTLGGLFTLNDLNIGIATWSVDDSITVVSGTSLSGAFSNLADESTIILNGITYTTEYTANSLILTVTAVPEPAAGLLVAGSIALAALRRRRAS